MGSLHRPVLLLRSYGPRSEFRRQMATGRHDSAVDPTGGGSTVLPSGSQVVGFPQLDTNMVWCRSKGLLGDVTSARLTAGLDPAEIGTSRTIIVHEHSEFAHALCPAFKLELTRNIVCDRTTG